MAILTPRSRRAALVTIVAWLVLATGLAGLAPKIASVEDNRNANSPPQSSESVRADEVLRQEFPSDRGLPALVVLRNPAGLDAADKAEVSRITEALTGPSRPERVAAVVSTANTPRASSMLVSADRTTTMIVVSVTGSASDEAFGSAVDRIREVAGRGTAERSIRVTGPAAIIRDTVKVFGSASLVLLFTTLGLVLVLMLLIYRSPLLALVPLLAVGVAIEVARGLGALAVKAGMFSVTAQAVSIMTVLLFGVGTDYCLFVIARYREEYAVTGDPWTAMGLAMRRVASTIFSSAATVVLALLALLMATLPALRGFGPFLALSVAVMGLIGLTLVPAAVALLGRAAFWPRAVARSRPAGESGGWHGLATAVTIRPVAALLASLAVLMLLSVGLVNYRDTYNFVTGFRVETDSRQGQQMLARAFPEGQLAPTSVLIRTPSGDLESRRADVDGIRARLAGLPGVVAAGNVDFSEDGSAARLTLTYDDNPYESRALERTELIRAEATALARDAIPGAQVLVGGESARSLDIRTASRRDLLVVGGLTILLVGVVLVALLRALVAPLYMIATIVASCAATLGLTVFVLLTLGGDAGMGVRVTIYIFVFLVALGVDYNILLVNRIREEVEQHGYCDGVRRALTRTGGVITSAGVILAGTFGVLMTQPIRELFQFGFAMCIGIMLDTLLIRAVMVPAIAQLLGARNWWPGRLREPVTPVRTPVGVHLQ